MDHPDGHAPTPPLTTSRPPWAKPLDAALVPLVASLAPWGVRDGHWLPGHDSTPVIWLRTRTRAQRGLLEAQCWLASQIALMLGHLGIPYHLVKAIRAEITSDEDEALLFCP